MRSIIGFLIAVCLCTNLCMAQEITEAARPMSLGTHNSFSILLLETDATTVSKTWQSFIKTYRGKTQYLTYSEEVFSDNAKMPLVSDNPVDVYAHAYDRGDGNVELQVWFFLGGVYLKSEHHFSGAEAARNLLRDFDNELGRQMLAIQLDQSEAELKAQERKSLKMDSERAKLEAKIAKMEADLAQTRLMLQTLDQNEETSAALQQQESEVQILKAQLEQAENH